MEVPLLNPRPRAPRGKTPPTGEDTDTDPDKPNKVSLKIFVDIKIPDRFPTEQIPNIQNKHKLTNEKLLYVFQVIFALLKTEKF